MLSVELTELPSFLTIFLFHSLLVIHYALLQVLPSFAWISTVVAVGSLFSFSLFVKPDIPFVLAYQRVVAVLFSMQMIRLQLDPSWSAMLRRLSLKNYLLSVISFGPADKNVAVDRSEPLSWRQVINEALFMLLKYLLINAIHLYYYYYPYRRDPPVRALLPLNLSAFIEYYLLAIQLFLYMSFYYAFSFGLFALLCGKLSPPLFDAPLLARSPREFWSKRWNMLFKQCLHDLIFVPTLGLFELLSPAVRASPPTSPKHRERESPRRGITYRRSRNSILDVQKEQQQQHQVSTTPSSKISSQISRHPVGALIAGQMTFLFSGIMHEYFLYVIFGLPPTWENLIFFNLHGLFCLLQIVLERLLPAKIRHCIPNWLSCVLTTLLFVYISPLFFNLFLRVDALNEYHLPLLLPLYDKWCLRIVSMKS